jgi:RNA polymerase sigma factor (sigma-70 family)
MGNAALFAAARAGDKNAWPELIRRHEGLVRAIISRFSLNSADSGDAVQNTWLRLIERADTVREPEKLGSWLATTARRECLAIVGRRRVEFPRATVDFDRPSADPTPEATVIAAEMRVCVRAATDALRGRPRALIDALYYRPESTYADVGSITGMPIGSIGPTRIRALRHLRRTLVDWAA